jgi:two-component system sensor histidine kinase RegB
VWIPAFSSPTGADIDRVSAADYQLADGAYRYGAFFMSPPDPIVAIVDPVGGVMRGEFVRLRTLILLRWGAILGQVTAIFVAWQYFDIDLDLGLCFATVGAAVIANLFAIFVYPRSKRLTEGEVLTMLTFDIAQLAVLLALTGGLNNPFALLILAPGTIAASTLNLRSAVAVGLLAIAFVTVIAFVHLPLLRNGTEILAPPIIQFGFWLAVVIGVVFLGLYAGRVATEIRSMSTALLATQMALAREQKLTDLGGVVAAAAHELGTPLATIKLTSTELAEELAGQPLLRADAELIRAQADRCRDILRSMGRTGKDDLHLRSGPVTAVVREAAEPHQGRGKAMHFGGTAETGNAVRQPNILRRPEIIHGLRNLVQNAVDFARANVWIDVEWSRDQVLVRIADDGPGYPPAIIDRIGDPFMRQRRTEARRFTRPEYEGMGLGLFIAKTLLQRTGAELSFANGSDPFLTEGERPARCGAIVEVVWPASRAVDAGTGKLGMNQQFVS